MARIAVQCKECGHRAKVPVAFAGKRVRCLRCQAKLTVPEAATRSRRDVDRRSGDRSSPRSGDRSSPRSGDRSSPRSGDRSSPRSGDRSSPRSGDRSSPRSGDRSSPRSGARSRASGSRRRVSEVQAERSARQGPSDAVRRKAQAAIREILEDAEYAIESNERGFLIDIRGVTFGHARTLVEELLEDAPGVRDVRLAGGLGECRMTVILKGAAFNPDDSFADEHEETEVYHRKGVSGQHTLDLDAIVSGEIRGQGDPVQRLLDEDAALEPPVESMIALVPDASTRSAQLDSDVEGLIEAGQAALEEGEVERAVKLLEKAVRVDKQHEEGVYALATAYASIGEYERARRAFRHFAKICPDDPDGHVMHAAASVACDRLDDARAALVKAMKIDPNNAQAYRYAARLYDRLGDPVKAQQFRQRYQQLKHLG